jgi:hypothetical protein
MSPRVAIVALLPSVLLGILCAHLYTEVQRERERARTESELRSELQDRLAKLDGTRAQPVREPGQARDHADEPGARRPPSRAMSAAVAPPPARVEALTQAQNMAGQPSAAQLEWMRSPIARDLMQSHQREWLRRSNEELFALLGLSPEQADSLVALMADGQSPALEFGVPGAPPDPVALEEMQNRLREHQRKTELAIRELLGEEKYRAYAEYQASAMERMQLAELRRLFEATPTPLRAEQSKQLLAALLEERSTVQLPSWISDRVVPTPEDMQRYHQMYEEQQLRVRERIAALLTPEQLERYRAYQQMQDAMNQDAGIAGGVAVEGGVMFSSSAVSSPE